MRPNDEEDPPNTYEDLEDREDLDALIDEDEDEEDLELDDEEDDDEFEDLDTPTDPIQFPI